MLVLAPNRRQTVEFRLFGALLVGPDNGELFVGQVPKRRQVRFDDLVQIGRTQGPVRHARQEGVGPGFEQLLAVAGELELPLELLMGDAGPREEAVGLGDPPIGQRRRREGHSEQQPSRDQKLRAIPHEKPIAHLWPRG